MTRLRVALFVAAMFTSAAPMLRAADDVSDFQTAFEAIVALDPVFAELAPSTAPGPGHDFVVGSKKVPSAGGAFQHLRVSAHSEPSVVDEQGVAVAPGENPKGSVRLTVSLPDFSFDVKGSVECLFVNGNVGLVAARIVEGSPPAPLFEGTTHVTLRIFDWGHPGSPPPDDNWDWYFMNGAPLFCAAFGFIGGEGGSGDIIVHDATPG